VLLNRITAFLDPDPNTNFSGPGPDSAKTSGPDSGPGLCSYICIKVLQNTLICMCSAAVRLLGLNRFYVTLFDWHIFHMKFDFSGRQATVEEWRFPSASAGHRDRPRKRLLVGWDFGRRALLGQTAVGVEPRPGLRAKRRLSGERGRRVTGQGQAGHVESGVFVNSIVKTVGEPY